MDPSINNELLNIDELDQWVNSTRLYLREFNSALITRFENHRDIQRALSLRTKKTDQLLRQAWRLCFKSDAPVSLWAVGGYGRRELFPHSDIDVFILIEEKYQPIYHQAIAQFIAMLWDIGLPMSHAVRSTQQMLIASQDATVFTALLEARPLLNTIAADYIYLTLLNANIFSKNDFFNIKKQELQQRHQRFGDTADNLEPNIKEGPGGLRDIHSLGWMSQYIWGEKNRERLIQQGYLGDDEAHTLQREYTILARLRYGLHAIAGRAEEQLRFNYQKLLAEKLGFIDDNKSLAVEQMMQQFYCSAALIRRINDRLLQRMEEYLDNDSEIIPINALFSIKNGYLIINSQKNIITETQSLLTIETVFSLFILWSTHSPTIKGLHSLTARALAESLPYLPSYLDASPAQRQQFIRLLQTPDAVDIIKKMARLGVLSVWIPAFYKVSGRMQFDLFHAYTVDQHTLMVLHYLNDFSKGKPLSKFSIAHEIWSRLRRPELLLLAGLFHDIAKGRGGDHSELGAIEAREFCLAHGLNNDDTELVAWLVQQHLILSLTAQKKDISDPVVIANFAKIMGERERLDYLYLLTCADVAGTSDKLWNAWKDRLFADLYLATRRALRDGLEYLNHSPQRIIDAKNAAILYYEENYLNRPDDAMISALFNRFPNDAFLRYRPEQLAWYVDCLNQSNEITIVGVRKIAKNDEALEVFIYSDDQDGLFAAIVAILDKQGYAVQQARLLVNSNHHIFDTFELIPADNHTKSEPELLRSALIQSLQQPLHSIRTTRRRLPSELKYFKFSPQILFSQTADGKRTQLTLTTPDRPGLLADIARVFREYHLRVHDARIATFGEKVDDLFQITDENNQPIMDAEIQAVLTTAILNCLDPK